MDILMDMLNTKTLSITHDILSLIAKIDEFKGAMTRLKAKVEREKLILAVLPELSLQLLELAKERGRITVQDAVILTAASRNTIKLHLQKLVADGQQHAQIFALLGPGFLQAQGFVGGCHSRTPLALASRTISRPLSCWSPGLANTRSIFCSPSLCCN